SIGGSAFLGCSRLTSVTVDENNQNYKSIDGNLYSKDGKTLMQYVIGKTATSFSIPDCVTSIGDDAFYKCSSLTIIEIPSSVTSIGDDAFYKCSSLTSIEIPSSVTSIGYRAFSDCNSLYYVKNNSKLTFTFGSDDYGRIAYYARILEDKNGNRTFENERDIFKDDFLFEYVNNKYRLKAYLGKNDTVLLPTDINGQSYAIYEMRGVINVVIPEGVTSIGSSAFEYCSSLTSIDIPSSVTSIGDWAFRSCSSLKSVKFGENSRLASIGRDAFQDCSSLTSIAIPSSVIYIGEWAFFDCSSLTSVTFKNTSGWWYSSSFFATSGTAISSSDLANVSTAAIFLKATYCSYFWKRT
ncbi:MAG: leucine-rich repeat domain-containing protein, partial [Clostridia bacterium]|nr:leucine-rich repeat domain-containing protein [Clostridia bacterium]